MDSFPLSLELRIDWSEIDYFGHVNNLAIIKYAQAARLNYLEAIGLMKMHSETQKGPILASINCQFLKPMFYPGGVTVRSKIETIKNTSFTIRHIIYNDKNEPASEIQDIIVFYDFTACAKLPIPDEIRRNIKSLENQD